MSDFYLVDADALNRFWQEAKKTIPDEVMVDDTLTKTDGVMSVATPVVGVLTQAEYDALPLEKKNIGTYVISDSGGLEPVVFTPSPSENGDLSWSNNGGLDNPPTVNIKGPKGDKGDTGDQGPKGDKGDTGDQGPKGDKGDTGDQGPKGDKGDTGDQGPKGDKGDTGDQGAKGDKGDPGVPGVPGDPGPGGIDGKSAYEYAVDGGYTGTEAQFQSLLGNGPWLPISGGNMTGVITTSYSGIRFKGRGTPAWPTSTPNYATIQMGATFANEDGTDISETSEDWLMIPKTIFTGDVSMNFHKIERVPDPTIATDVANKRYVDSAIPYGGIIIWSGAADNIPAGWALCDGTNGTPDLRGRFVLGASDSYAVGSTGGAAEVTLTARHMPSHAHELTPAPTSGPSGSYKFIDSSAYISKGSTQEAMPNPDRTSKSTYMGSTGGDKPHNNMPPYYALAYIMRVST